jgi:hypothetical protein
VELKKAKIILFSDLLGGFDLVLKIRDLHLINNKQSQIIQSIDGLEEDPDFQGCDTVSEKPIRFISLGSEHRSNVPTLL